MNTMHFGGSISHASAVETVKEASQSLRPQAQRKWKSFSPAACTSEKIPLGSQTCALCAVRAQCVRCREPQPFQTKAQRSGFRLRACQKHFFDKPTARRQYAVGRLAIQFSIIRSTRGESALVSAHPSFAPQKFATSCERRAFPARSKPKSVTSSPGCTSIPVTSTMH